MHACNSLRTFDFVIHFLWNYNLVAIGKNKKTPKYVTFS